jgi:hypothetical protein
MEALELVRLDGTGGGEVAALVILPAVFAVAGRSGNGRPWGFLRTGSWVLVASAGGVGAR